MPFRNAHKYPCDSAGYWNVFLCTNSLTHYENSLDDYVGQLQRRLHFSGQQKVLSKQAGSWNLISVTSYSAVCLVNQVKFCKCKSWNTCTTFMLKTKKNSSCLILVFIIKLWLVPWVGKMKHTLHSNWLTKQARWD